MCGKLKVKVVAFDLFDTLLDKEKFDFNIIVELLLSKYLKGVTKSQFNEWASEYRSEIMSNRDVTNRESRFVDQLEFYETRAEIRFDNNYRQIEKECFLACRKEKLGRNVKETLDYLVKKGYKLAVISNSIFSSECLKDYMDQFGILRYFDLVVSSADLGVRKPSPEIFIKVCNYFFVETNEACYIGNNYEKDILGSSSSGMTPIYYNRKNDKKDCMSIVNMGELKSIL